MVHGVEDGAEVGAQRIFHLGAAQLHQPDTKILNKKWTFKRTVSHIFYFWFVYTNPT
jgi:hypothetical protein